MQLRTTPAERECKEKVNRKIKRERKRKLRLGIVLKPPCLPAQLKYYYFHNIVELKPLV